MKRVTIKVPLVEDSYLAMKSAGFSTSKEIQREIKIATAIDLFRNKKFSLGKAAELAELPVAKFMDLLEENDIPVTDYSDEDLEEDLKTIGSLQWHKAK